MVYDFQMISETNVTKGPEDGVYVYGMFLDGARFNRDLMIIDESYPKILYDELPYVS